MRFRLILILLASILIGCAPPFSWLPSRAIPAGSVLFKDDFSSTASGWDRARYDGGVVDYDGGGYRILVNAQQSNFWSTPAREFQDTRIEVDAGKLAGPDENRIGLICRSDGESHYFFLIGSDGYSGLGVFIKGKAALLGQSEMKPSDAITKGAAVNHLRLDCNGSILTGYVNGFPVSQVQDGTLTHGKVGVLAGTFTEPGTDIVFDNFVVYQP